MARREKKTWQSPGQSWLITLSDLLTLLLTFFVLLLTMSSMDVSVLSRISAYSDSRSMLDSGGKGRIPERIVLLVKMLRDPETLLEKKHRIKDLLFPLDVLPKELPPGDLQKNLEILAHPEGVVIVLTGELLFPQGSAELDDTGKKLLDALAPVILATNSDVNISGHTDSAPAKGISNDDLSALRALAALDRFLPAGIQADRFSISGYGADKPMFSNNTEEGRRKNRRVEILLKTAPRVGKYL